jgi:hypothetical protein
MCFREQSRYLELEQEYFVDASVNECAKKREQPNFDVGLWFDLLEERYQCEKKVWTIFAAGDRSRYTGLMYLEFRAALFAGGKLRANA